MTQSLTVCNTRSDLGDFDSEENLVSITSSYQTCLQLHIGFFLQQLFNGPKTASPARPPQEQRATETRKTEGGTLLQPRGDGGIPGSPTARHDGRIQPAQAPYDGLRYVHRCSSTSIYIMCRVLLHLCAVTYVTEISFTMTLSNNSTN